MHVWDGQNGLRCGSATNVPIGHRHDAPDLPISRTVICTKGRQGARFGHSVSAPGTRLARMIELVRRDFVVDVPLQDAWNRLSLVEDWPSWAKHIKAVRRPAR
jgi:hypothetical protein